MRVVCLAGGVGGAKLADGLARVLDPGELTVIVNTGDDLERHGLIVCPDHDTVLYTLAGIADPVQGWGLAGETWSVAGQLARLGEETWFRLGDRDMATHLLRTERLRAGRRPTEVAGELAERLGVRSSILPMTDSTVRTKVRTDEGWLDFQDYFVRRRQEPTVREVAFEGVDSAEPTAEILAAFKRADVVVLAPSNPIVSIGPILAVPGMIGAIGAARRRGVPAVAVSGIVGGKALRGPADRMLASLGEEASALGVARRYARLDAIDHFVLDEQDRGLVPAIDSLGLRTLVTETVMTDGASRAALAREMLEFAAGRQGAARAEELP